jgi:hypothetical protein
MMMKECSSKVVSDKMDVGIVEKKIDPHPSFLKL